MGGGSGTAERRGPMASNPNQNQRVRTITWEDPALSARDSAMSGLEYLQHIRDGQIKPPPAAMLLGYRLCEVEPGRAVFELEPAEYHYNPFASVHGGIASTLLDSAMTAAILSTLPAGSACSTLEINVNFVRPIVGSTGLLRCEARILHGGSRIATAEGRVADVQARLFAHATTTCMVFQ